MQSPVFVAYIPRTKHNAAWQPGCGASPAEALANAHYPGAAGGIVVRPADWVPTWARAEARSTRERELSRISRSRPLTLAEIHELGEMQLGMVN